MGTGLQGLDEIHGFKASSRFQMASEASSLKLEAQTAGSLIQISTTQQVAECSISNFVIRYLAVLSMCRRDIQFVWTPATATSTCLIFVKVTLPEQSYELQRAQEDVC